MTNQRICSIFYYKANKTYSGSTTTSQKNLDSLASPELHLCAVVSAAILQLLLNNLVTGQKVRRCPTQGIVGATNRETA